MKANETEKNRGERKERKKEREKRENQGFEALNFNR